MGKGSGDGCRPAMRMVQAIEGIVDEPLLKPTVWREQVFARSDARCVRCGEQAVAAHHLFERQLFPDGGYYPSNGVALCSECHLDAEGCVVLPSELREAARLTNVILPPEAATDDEYDKWLNPVATNGVRYMGPLFWRESCQRALDRAGTLDRYQRRMKYPRTYHLASSPGKSPDDLAFDADDRFVDREVVVTMKMDGENTTIGADYVHARSIDSSYHPSRTWTSALAARIGHELPPGWRVCGENLQAEHSIRYRGLPSFFTVFSIWNERNECLSWDETQEWAELLELETVPEIYRGPWVPSAVQAAFEAYRSPWSEEKEGYVVRCANGFSYDRFRDSLGKWVRAGHVQTGDRWMHAKLRENSLA